MSFQGMCYLNRKDVLIQFYDLFSIAYASSHSSFIVKGFEKYVGHTLM